MIKLDLNPPLDQLRQFGWIALFGFPGVGLLLGWQFLGYDHIATYILYGLGGLCGVLAMVAPVAPGFYAASGGKVPGSMTLGNRDNADRTEHADRLALLPIESDETDDE